MTRNSRTETTNMDRGTLGLSCKKTAKSICGVLLQQSQMKGETNSDTTLKTHIFFVLI